jgi:hypothetical protein
VPSAATSLGVCLGEPSLSLPSLAVVQIKLYGGANVTLPITVFFAYYHAQDKLEKDRLMKRRFGHIRHNCYYKGLTEPATAESLAWMDPKRKEFLGTDVVKFFWGDEEKRRARQKVILHYHGYFLLFAEPLSLDVRQRTSSSCSGS